MAIDVLSHLAQYPVDRWAESPVIRAILAIGILADFISWIAVTCSSVTRQRQPFSEPPHVFPLRLCDLLPGVNTLCPDLGLILSDRGQDPGMKPPGR